MRSGKFGVMRILDSGERRPAMVWLVAVGGRRDGDRSLGANRRTEREDCTRMVASMDRLQYWGCTERFGKVEGDRREDQDQESGGQRRGMEGE